MTATATRDCVNCGNDITGEMGRYQHTATGNTRCAADSPNLTGAAICIAAPAPRCPECDAHITTTQQNWMDRTVCSNADCGYVNIRMIGD